MEGYIIDWRSWVAGFAVLASLIGTVSALLIARSAQRIAKKNLSASVELQLIQFREKWISELRDEFSGFIGVQREGVFDDEKRLRNNSHFHKICLLMNPNDPQFGALMDQMAELSKRKTFEMAVKAGIDDIFDDPEEVASFQNTEKYNAANFQIIAQTILKNEWDRLKQDLDKYHA